MRIFYDTEFVERGAAYPIVLVSIGMVREDGEEYYAINGDLSLEDQAYLRGHEWLGPNVWEKLPRAKRHVAGEMIWDLVDIYHPDVKALSVIATEVSAFCRQGTRPGGKAELWAYYADYDHVVLSQLFGRMIDLPRHMPMFTRDLMQHIEEHGITKDRLPKQSAEYHNALFDARWVRDAWGYVNGEGR